MKIGQFTDSYLPIMDGTITVVRNYARLMNDKQHSCCIVAPNNPGYTDDEPYEVIRCRSVSIPKRPPYRMAVPISDLRTLNYLTKQNFDIIHSHSPFAMGMLGRDISVQKRIPLVATFHSKYYDDIKQVTNSDSLAELGTQILMNYFKYADLVCTVNNSTVATMRQYGYEGEVFVLPNGTDCVYPADPEALKRTAESRFNIKPGETVFLFVGQLVWQKNIRTIIEACALLKEHGLRFKMVMAGSGYAQEEIHRLVSQLGLEQDFIFTGLLYDRQLLNALYLRSQLFVFPSVYDNAPLVVREAAVMRCPSVLVGGSNAAESVIDRKNGYLCTNSPQSLCETIYYAITHEEERRQIGLCASQSIPVSWESVISTVLGKYEELIRNQKKPARRYTRVNWKGLSDT